MSRARRWSLLGAAGLALAAGAATAAALLARTWPLGRLPSWDAAGNGWGAVELWAALSRGHLVDFLIRANAQDTWPFGFSLLMLPFVAAGGGGFESAALLPALAFALVPPLLVWAGGEVDRDARGLAAGLLAGALWLTSPLPRALASVSLRETTGAALAVAVLAAYLRARRLGTLGAWRVAAGLLLSSFFTKYNYFLLVGAAIGLHAVLEMGAARRRELAREAWSRIAQRGWRQPARWIALVVAVSIVSLAVGQNPGNFLYVCLVLATAAALSVRWRSALRPSEALSRLPPAARGFVEWLVVPIWIWSLSPRPVHPRSVFAFLRNRTGDLPPLSADAIAFYPRAWLGEFSPPGPLGWVVAGLAVAGMIWLARRDDAARALALAAGVGLLAAAVHPLKEPRFLATVAPLLFLLAARSATRLGSLALAAAASPRSVGGVFVALALTGILAEAKAGGALARLEGDHRSLTAGPEFLAPLTAAAFWAAAPGAERVALLGGVNQLSESLVRWETWRGHSVAVGWVRPLRGLDGESSPEEVELRLARWLERTGARRVVALVPLPSSRWLADIDYRRFNAWQLSAVAALERDGRWWVERRRVFPAVGLELRSFALRERVARRLGPPRRADRVNPSNAMIVEKKRHGEHTVLRVEGVVKLGESAEFLAETLSKLLADGGGHVLVDLERINYIDSTGIGELVGYFGKFRDQGRRLILVRPADRIRKLLEVARLDEVFPTYDTMDSALAAEAG